MKERFSIQEVKGIKKWRPEEGEKYYYIDDEGRLMDSGWKESRGDLFRFSAGNCFKKLDEAYFKIKQIKVYSELKNFAVKNNGLVDWIDWTQKKILHNLYIR